MKKTSIYLIVLSVMLLLSCEKDSLDKNYFLGESKSTYLKTTLSNQASEPVSTLGIIPNIIAGTNRGGNRTCDEVAVAFNTTFDLCGDKNDYGASGFLGKFPKGLNVNVNGNFISFNMDNCILIGGKNYKVGAVIVKGSNAANVYFYPNGTTHDERLAAPNAENMVSNLTFCFVECKQLNIVIAIKTSFWWTLENGTSYITYGGSNGPIKPFSQEAWCADLGAYNYPEVNTFDIYRALIWDKTGSVFIKEENNNVVITVKWDEGILPTRTDIYAGSLDGLQKAVNASNIPIYYASPWRANLTSDKIQIFSIPLAQL